MKTDGLVPLAFGDKDGWPAMGTFDILNMRMNGYDFHVGLMAGTEKWTDPKVKAVFETWKELLPYYSDGAARHDLAGRRPRTCSTRRPGMYFLGTFAGAAGDRPGRPCRPRLLPVPDARHRVRRRARHRRPDRRLHDQRQGPSNLDGAKAFMECLATGAGAEHLPGASSPNNVAAANDADTSTYTPFQKKSAEIIGGVQRIAQFLDRDTRSGLRRRRTACRASCRASSASPTQDLAALSRASRTSGTRLPPLSDRRSSDLDRSGRDPPSLTQPPRRRRRRGGSSR